MASQDLSGLHETVGGLRSSVKHLQQEVKELREEFKGFRSRLTGIIVAALVGPTAALYLAHLLHF